MEEASYTRRAFLRTAGAVGILAYASPQRVRALVAETARTGHGRFLTDHELRTLRAVTARFIPGPPDDPDPGAVEGHCAEAIDLFLGALEVDPPLIHAGGPFSDRAGSPVDDFAHFVPLDPHAELGWRIRLEGTQGRADREFAGPLKGLQEVYRTGLAHLDQRAQDLGSDFKDLPGPAQDLILSDQSDDKVQELVGAALDGTLESMYGPPEYGGNHHLVGWSYTKWPGDRQPKGYTRDQVTKAGKGSLLSAAQAEAVLKFLPALSGRAAPRDRFWLGFKGLPR